MMSDERFILCNKTTDSNVWDTLEKQCYGWEYVVSLLNELNDENKTLKKENEQLRKYNGQLKERLEKINGGYGHLTHRNGLTANEWLIESQERELKKKNGQISDWIERHSKDIVKIGEQKATISQLEEEKEYWKGKAMTLLMQVRRLTPRMTDKEVIEFSKELEDE